MIPFAQAVAEYAGASSQVSGGGSLGRAFDRLANATPVEYLILGVGALFLVFLLVKLLDAV